MLGLNTTMHCSIQNFLRRKKTICYCIDFKKMEGFMPRPPVTNWINFGPTLFMTFTSLTMTNIIMVKPCREGGMEGNGRAFNGPTSRKGHHRKIAQREQRRWSEEGREGGISGNGGRVNFRRGGGRETVCLAGAWLARSLLISISCISCGICCSHCSVNPSVRQGTVTCDFHEGEPSSTQSNGI